MYYKKSTPDTKKLPNGGFLRQHKKVPKNFLNSKMCLKSQF